MNHGLYIYNSIIYIQILYIKLCIFFDFFAISLVAKVNLCYNFYACMKFSLLGKSTSILLAGILLVAAISTGCTNSFLPELESNYSSNATTVAQAESEKDEKICTCSLKKQVTDFLVNRVASLKHLTDSTDAAPDLVKVTEIDFAFLIEAASSPPPNNQLSLVPEPIRDWPVMLARAHL